MSPSALKPFGIKCVCILWNISQSTIQRHKVLALHGATPKKRGPKTCLADAQLFEEIKIVLRNSPFVGEGYRKVWAWLRQETSVFSAPRRILRIMRVSNLLAPTRRRASPGPRTHDGIIVTQRPDEMWAVDGTSCITDQGSATVFVVIDHCTSECLGAIDMLRQAIRATRGIFDRDVAEGVALRYDHGSQFISHAFQDELRFVGIRSSPSFVRSPEGNGCVERFIRTLKEQLLWLTRLATVDELDVALRDFAHRYNNHWILGRLGYKTPAQHRLSFLVEAALFIQTLVSTMGSCTLPLKRITNSPIYFRYKNLRASVSIPLGIDLSIFHPSALTRGLQCSSVVTIGCIGRSEPEKGIIYVLHAFEALHKLDSRFRLRVAYGNLPHKWSHPQCEVVIPKNDNELADYYRSLDILIAPGTVQHGAPHYPVLEAGSCGVTVVTTGYMGATPDTAWIVANKDVKSIVNSVTQVVSDHKVRINKRTNFLTESSKYGWNRVSSTFIDCFESI